LLLPMPNASAKRLSASLPSASPRTARSRRGDDPVARVNPSGYAGRINPGEAESGTITLHQDPGGEVTLEWRVVEVGSGATYTLTRTIR